MIFNLVHMAFVKMFQFFELVPFFELVSLYLCTFSLSFTISPSAKTWILGSNTHSKGTKKNLASMFPYH